MLMLYRVTEMPAFLQREAKVVDGSSRDRHYLRKVFYPIRLK